MKKCLYCGKTGFKDSDLRCSYCDSILVTDASAILGAASSSSSSSRPRVSSTGTQADDPLPRYEAPASGSRRTSRPRVSSDGGTQATGDTFEPQGGGASGAFDRSRNTGATGSAAYDPPPAGTERARRAPDAARSLPLIGRILVILLGIALAIGVIVWVTSHWAEIRQLFSIFLGGAVVGLVVFLFLGRGRLDPRWILGFCGIFGILGIILAYNLFDVGGSLTALLNAVMPSVIIIGALWFLIRGIFRP